MEGNVVTMCSECAGKRRDFIQESLLDVLAIWKELNNAKIFFKVFFSEGNQMEGLWVDTINIEGSLVTGEVSNDPVILKNITDASIMQFDFNDIDDIYITTGDINDLHVFNWVEELHKRGLLKEAAYDNIGCCRLACEES